MSPYFTSLEPYIYALFFPSITSESLAVKSTTLSRSTKSVINRDFLGFAGVFRLSATVTATVSAAKAALSAACSASFECFADVFRFSSVYRRTGSTALVPIISLRSMLSGFTCVNVESGTTAIFPSIARAGRLEHIDRNIAISTIANIYFLLSINS